MDHLKDISITQLRYFIAAAERESMTRAAEDLFVAQSAISSAVTHLERELRTQLFIRRRAKGLILTSAGSKLLMHARRVLDSLAESLEELATDGQVTWGDLHVVCFSTIVPFYLPDILAGLRDDHPGLTVHVSEAVGGEVSAYLETGRAEVALTYDLGLGDLVERETLAEMRPYLALSQDHPLAGHSRLRLADLVAEPMILVDLPHSRDYFLSIFTGLGLTPNIQYRSSNYEAVRAMVAQNHGYAVLNQRPAMDSTYAGGRVVAVPIAEDVPCLDIVLASLKSARISRRAEVFGARCREVVRAAAGQGAPARTA
ncbi:LysR family transcriptional regulator [Prauserella oleivorans]|uniref:LysR family transcriptional regulator n=1 Tax=Prauserella oleivorans TaxID=1478153 RepID=A0ABW5WEU0_9PSEU